MTVVGAVVNAGIDLACSLLRASVRRRAQRLAAALKLANAQTAGLCATTLDFNTVGEELSP